MEVDPVGRYLLYTRNRGDVLCAVVTWAVTRCRRVH